MKNFRNLQVWQRAHKLALSIYEVTAKFPNQEMYGLTSQLRRACSSVPANLAEGCGRQGDAELARFCSIATGSACELEYHLLLAKDLKLIPASTYLQLAKQSGDVRRMLSGFRRTLVPIQKSRKLLAVSC